MVICPDCGQPAKQASRLAKHYQDIHHCGKQEAQARAQQIFAGLTVPTLSTDLGVRQLIQDASALDVEEVRTYFLLVLEALASSKHLPKAQFERRVEPLLAPFMSDVVALALGEPGDSRLVAAEFPLKSSSNNQSTNADALFTYGGAFPRWVLVEVKTTASSFDLDQLRRYVHARDHEGMLVLRDGLTQIHAASKAKVAYYRLLTKLDEAAAVVGLNAPIEIVYLVPDDLKRAHLKALHDCEVHVVTFTQLRDVRLRRNNHAWQVVQALLLL